MTCDEELLEKLEAGVARITDAVGSTLGPKGRNVIIERKYGSPTVTKDGVTVAREIFLEDSVENMAAQLVKEAAVRTNDTSGDGTSTSTVLACAFFAKALDLIRNGASPIDVKNKIDDICTKAVAWLKKKSRAVTGEELENVAAISANDKEIGKLVYKVLGDNPNKVVTVEEAGGLTTEVENVDGIRVDRGFVSHYMMTSPERSEAVLNNPAVLVTDSKMASGEEMLMLMETLARNGRKELLVICEDIEGDALATLVANKMRGNFMGVAVKAPGFGETKSEVLKDIAIICGCEVIGQTTGLSLGQPDLKLFGSAKKVVVTKDNTTVVGGAGSKDLIVQRAEQVKKLITKAKSQFDKDRLADRLGKLTGGVSVIKVGAATESSIKEIKQRVEDALQATVAASEEGVLPGGGNALAICANELKDTDQDLVDALREPYRQIGRNADNMQPVPSVWDVGMDMATGEEKPSLLEAGIMDPTKVTRSALENAASIAGLLTMSAFSLTFLPQEENNK